MSIVRVRRQSSFTVIPNEIINDDTLDGATLGLLVYLLSKPPTWDISVRAISDLKRFGSHDKVMRSLKLLRQLGYAKLQKLRDGTTDWTITDAKGSFSSKKNDTKTAETPVFEPNPQNQDLGICPYPQNQDLGIRIDDMPETPVVEPNPQNKDKAGTPVVEPNPYFKDVYKELKENKKLSKSTRTKKTNAPDKTPLPADFQISENIRKWYAKKAFTEPLDEHFERFCDKARQNGYVYADWDAALRNAINEDWAKLRKPKFETQYRDTRQSAEPKSRSKHTILA